MRLALLALLAACGSPELPPLVARTAHFEVHAWDAVDAQFLAMLERHHEIVGDWLGARPERVVIYLHRDYDELESACGTPAGGCAYGRETHMAGFVPHELVHAYSSELGRSAVFFAEGLAEILGCAAEDREVVVPDPALVRARLETDAFREAAVVDRHPLYLQAASFFHYLVERHGREAVLRLYAWMEEDASSARIDAMMTVVFGEGLDALLDGWVARGPRARLSLCLRVAECAMPPLDGVTLAVAPPLEGASGAAHVYGTFDAPEAIRVRSRGAGVVMIAGSCAAPHETQIILTRRGEAWLRLPPGRVWVYVAGAPGDTANFSAMANPFSDDCQAAPLVELPDVDDLVVHDALATGTTSLRLQGAEASTLSVRTLANWEPQDVSAVEMCDACDGSCASGTPIFIDRRPLAPGVPTIVTMSGTPSGLGFRLGMWPRL